MSVLVGLLRFLSVTFNTIKGGIPRLLKSVSRHYLLDLQVCRFDGAIGSAAARIEGHGM